MGFLYRLGLGLAVLISVSFRFQCKGYGQCCHLTNGMKADADLILELSARTRSAISS